jgi:hypothetical protein
LYDVTDCGRSLGFARTNTSKIPSVGVDPLLMAVTSGNSKRIAAALYDIAHSAMMLAEKKRDQLIGHRLGD